MRSMVVGHAEDLETLGWGRLRPVQLQGAPVVDVDVLLSIDILQSVSRTIGTEGNAHTPSILLVREEETAWTDPSAIESAGDGEDVALLILGVVDDPSLRSQVMVLDGRLGGKMFTRVRVGQRCAALLKDQVTALGQIANALLEPVFKEKGIVGIFLVAIRDIRPLTRVAIETNIGTNVVASPVENRVFSLRNLGKRHIGWLQLVS